MKHDATVQQRGATRRRHINIGHDMDDADRLWQEEHGTQAALHVIITAITVTLKQQEEDAREGGRTSGSVAEGVCRGVAPGGVCSS